MSPPAIDDRRSMPLVASPSSSRPPPPRRGDARERQLGRHQVLRSVHEVRPDATTAPTVSAVINPSPIPTRPCTLDHRRRTPSFTGASPSVPPIAYSARTRRDAITTERTAATPDAATTDHRRGRREHAADAEEDRVATDPAHEDHVQKMFSPSAAGRRRRTAGLHDEHEATAIAPVQGRPWTAASTPPSRCPLVPAATGKFSICRAKTNAATSPAIGAGAPRERLLGSHQRVADAAGRGRPGRDRDPRAQEPIRYVHRHPSHSHEHVHPCCCSCNELHEAPRGYRADRGRRQGGKGTCTAFRAGQNARRLAVARRRPRRGRGRSHLRCIARGRTPPSAR